MTKSFISAIAFLSMLPWLTVPSAAMEVQIPDCRNEITCDRLESDLSFLADDKCRGRESGTDGNEIARRYIINRFRSLGLSPVGWQYTQSFEKNGTIFRNVVGIIRSSAETSRSIVICAHYDHIGEINGTIYNGADDNASGVSAMLGIAGAFAGKKESGEKINCNVIFVATDGKEKDMCGSRHFIENSGLKPEDIVCAINIDIIGTDLVPFGSNRNYIIALGENTLPHYARGYLSSICYRKEYGLDLSLSFYGSRKFTQLLYEAGDQGSFAKKRIPAIFFTSGFHDHTYKADDDTAIINFDLLCKRTKVIYDFAEYILRNQ